MRKIIQEVQRPQRLSKAMLRRTGEPNPLHQTLVIADCFNCGRSIDCKVEDVLYQPDYAGLDYEDGGQDATLQCGEDCGGIYVTRICLGTPTFDSGYPSRPLCPLAVLRLTLQAIR